MKKLAAYRVGLDCIESIHGSKTEDMEYDADVRLCRCDMGQAYVKLLHLMEYEKRKKVVRR